MDARRAPSPKGTVMYNLNPELQLKIVRDRQEQLRRIAGHNRLLREHRRHRRRS
jgi:hypothetical protein